MTNNKTICFHGNGCIWLEDGYCERFDFRPEYGGDNQFSCCDEHCERVKWSVIVNG